MAAERRSNRALGLAVRPDRPLIGVVLVEDGQEVTRYFADEADAEATGGAQTASDGSRLGRRVERPRLGGDGRGPRPHPARGIDANAASTMTDRSRAG